MPRAVPTIPPSVSGVSKTRSPPNSSCSPCVARKTPPNLPTSSPRTTTSGSRRISVRSASFTAWITFRVAMSEILRPRRHAGIRGDGRAQLLQLLPLLPQRLGVHVGEERLERRPWRQCLRLGDGPLDLLLRLLRQRLPGRPRERPAPLQEGPETQQRVPPPP